MSERIEYDYKIIVSGTHFEEYRYERTQRRGFRRKVRPPRDQSTVLDKPKTVSSFSYYRAKQRIKRLVNANPSMDKFVTLTFADHITDLAHANVLFNRFIKRLRYRYGDFRYLAVPEFTRIGRVHYHLVCSLPFVKNSRLRGLWRHGFVNIKAVRSMNNIGLYLSKYLSKDTALLLFNKKKFFTSENIEEYQELFNIPFAIPSTAIFDFGTIFLSKYTGRVEYSCLHSPPPCPVQ